MAAFAARPLGDYLRIKHGHAFKGEFFSHSGDFVLLTPGNFGARGGLKLKGDKEKFYTGEIPSDFVLRQGDLLVAMTDLTQNAPILGAPAFIPKSGRFLHNQRLGKVVEVAKSSLDLRYLFHLLNLPSVREQIKATATGATVRHTAPDRIYAVRAPIPPLAVQRRLADVLCAYDDLIENNARRVEMIEEATRIAFALAEARAVAGHARSLGDVADSGGGTVRTGPFGSQLHEADYSIEGTPVVMPKNILAGRIDTSGIARVPDDVVDRVEQHKLHPGDIVYGRRGDIGRHAYVGRHQEGWLCGTGCLRISLGSGPLHSRYLHEFLGKAEVVSRIAGQAVGATMPNLNTSILRGIQVPIPDTDAQRLFVAVALTNDDLVENLRAQNGLLEAQCDLVLPRLISGEVEPPT